MAREGLPASSAPQLLPGHRQGRSTWTQSSIWEQRDSPGLACSFLCFVCPGSTAPWLPLLSRQDPRVLTQGFALLSRLSHQVRARDAGAQALWRLFFLHPAIAVDDHKYLRNSAASTGCAANPTAPPTTARVLHCRRNRGGSWAAMSCPPEACATAVPCLRLRQMVTPCSSSSSSGAMVTVRGDTLHG